MTIGEWRGLVNSRTDANWGVTIIGLPPGAAAGASWSGPFRAIGDDGRDYFVKSLETCPAQQEASLAIEMIVARMGELIGAPVCETRVARIPAMLAGWSPRPGATLSEGLAHASVALEHADEYDRPKLYARSQDDNARRHVGVYALYDWCFGNDPQWLYDLDDDRRLHSHDHGLYLPPQGSGTLDSTQMIAMVGIANELLDPRVGLLPAAVEQVADALEAVDRATLANVLNSVPASWPVADDVLETVGWFLEERRTGVAARVRALI